MRPPALWALQPRAASQRTVIVIDEASTLGNRALARLVRHTETAGATLRLVGDPAQHGAVEAGGLFAHLARSNPNRTPTLTVDRRQTTEHMADVRHATADYRAGRIAQARTRLDTNQRIVTAPTASELLDALAADWYDDRTRHHAHPDRTAASHMVAEHHHERRALNRRAQALLLADGTLTGPGVDIADSTFHVGDHVITHEQHRGLRPRRRMGPSRRPVPVHPHDLASMGLWTAMGTVAPTRTISMTPYRR